jgi:hypothetical protein
VQHAKGAVLEHVECRFGEIPTLYDVACPCRGERAGETTLFAVFRAGIGLALAHRKLHPREGLRSHRR